MTTKTTRTPASDVPKGPFSEPSDEDGGTSPFRRIHTMPATIAHAMVASAVEGKTELLRVPEPVESAHTVSSAAPVPEVSSEEREERTSPGMVPAAVAAAQARKTKRGEVAQLLNAIAPFLWSLEGAQRWVQQRADAGEADALVHARSMGLLAQILAQLQARLDELAKME